MIRTRVVTKEYEDGRAKVWGKKTKPAETTFQLDRNVRSDWTEDFKKVVENLREHNRQAYEEG